MLEPYIRALTSYDASRLVSFSVVVKGEIGFAGVPVPKCCDYFYIFVCYLLFSLQFLIILIMI